MGWRAPMIGSWKTNMILEASMLPPENEFNYIPIGVVHALKNPGKKPLELIEVQPGSYLS